MLWRFIEVLLSHLIDQEARDEEAWVQREADGGREAHLRQLRARAGLALCRRDGLHQLRDFGQAVH